MKNAFTSDEEEGAILLMALSMAWSMPDYLWILSEMLAASLSSMQWHH
jgi:hypothetical protein